MNLIFVNLCLILSIFITLSSCTKVEQPQCSNEIVQSTLKEAYLKTLTDNSSGLNIAGMNRDTNDIAISAIRTLSKNEDVRSCECGAHIDVKAKNFSFIYFQAINDDIQYTAQFTDDGKMITVKIHN